MTKYRKKPVEMEAMQWTGDNADEMFSFTRSFTPLPGSGTVTASLWVEANRAWLDIETGEWVIRDAKGFYPCKPDIFKATYEAVE